VVAHHKKKVGCLPQLHIFWHCSEGDFNFVFQSWSTTRYFLLFLVVCQGNIMFLALCTLLSCHCQFLCEIGSCYPFSNRVSGYSAGLASKGSFSFEIYYISWNNCISTLSFFHPSFVALAPMCCIATIFLNSPVGVSVVVSSIYFLGSRESLNPCNCGYSLFVLKKFDYFRFKVKWICGLLKVDMLLWIIWFTMPQ